MHRAAVTAGLVCVPTVGYERQEPGSGGLPCPAQRRLCRHPPPLSPPPLSRPLPPPCLIPSLHPSLPLSRPLLPQRFPPGADRFEGVQWRPAPGNGCPVLQESIAHMECVVRSRMETPDHWLCFAGKPGGAALPLTERPAGAWGKASAWGCMSEVACM